MSAIRHPIGAARRAPVLLNLFLAVGALFPVPTGECL